MKITLRYFASYREIIGLLFEEIEIQPGSTLKKLLETVKKLHEPLAEAKGLMFALNGEYKDIESILMEGDIVALFPPVSGG